MLRIAYAAEHYAHSLPEGHRFPMAKYDLIPAQLLYEGTISEENLFAPEPIDEHWVLQTHEAAYWERLKTLSLSPAEVRRTGFPLSAELVQRELRIAQGTVENALYALQYGVSMNVAGGTHHAFSNRGEGFCLLNDFAIASNYLLQTGRARRVLIVDLDVHQGNGTAQIFAQQPSVFTFSMHGAHNYPLQKESSTLDIPLPDGTDDATYLGLLRQHLPAIFDRFQPDFVCYLAGVDILASDKLGKLAVSKAGCKERDRFVLQSCYTHRVPVAIALGGGYSPHLRDIVEAHCNTFRLAREIWF
jgi:acetoin utilization deacetylase AcuC-like enzyme